jgi:hypothetical protein
MRRYNVNVRDAFHAYQKVVNADDEQVREARRRRDLFKDAFGSEPDVKEVIASGSLARGTEKAPIRDVDTIIIFSDSSHPGWGEPGGSAADALSYVGARVNALLGATNGEHSTEVRLARPRNHAVKCFLDDPDDPNAFTVDAMPAFRRDGMLLVPQKRTSTWIPTDPEYLIERTAAAHSSWNSFAPLVRVLKAWKTRLPDDLDVKSLYMEVLALACLPREGQRPQALAAFFTAAAAHVRSQVVEDPAGVCGPIQPDLDVVALAGQLDDAARISAEAVEAEARGEFRTATRGWREVLGPDFPLADGDGDGGGGSDGPNPSPSLLTGVAGGGGLLTPRPVRDLPQG